MDVYDDPSLTTTDDEQQARLTVIVVSYNTRELTLRALETLLDQTRQTQMTVIAFDNASQDGSADAIAERFPHVELIRSEENLGFSRANNRVAERAQTEWILLLNPDTEVLDGAVDKLLAFADAHPGHGIYGGRTVFADGSLNPGSCWMRITPWSAFCTALGLNAIFRKSEVFNSESMGGWQRDTVREVDIVQGSFFLVDRALWHGLTGFDPKYFMYGEEADLCLRAREHGAAPIFTPDAEIVHLAGAASPTRGDKQVLLAQGRATLIRDHWPAWQVPFGLGCMWFGVGLRHGVLALLGKIRPSRFRERSDAARMVWDARSTWMRGYGD